MVSPDHHLQSMMSALTQITADMQDYYPKAFLLFGSLARRLAGESTDRLPNDVDLLVVVDNFPLTVVHANYGCLVELHRFTTERMVRIARSLRYDSRPIALSKLYGRVVARQHAIDVIAAAMLLGPGYGDFGIEQIEINGVADPRDYSIHRVLVGEAWWTRLREYASQRRGPFLRFSDKLSGIDTFDE